jgi:hypothetical protein
MKYMQTLFLLVFILLFVYSNVNSSSVPIVITNINSKNFELISIPKFHYIPSQLSSPAIIVKLQRIKKNVECNLYKVRERYIYPFSKRLLVKQTLPVSGVIILAGRLKNIVIHSHSNTSVDISTNIETPKQLNPLMKDTLWGYLTSDQAGGKAIFGYSFK